MAEKLVEYSLKIQHQMNIQLKTKARNRAFYALSWLYNLSGHLSVLHKEHNGANDRIAWKVQ